MLDPRSKTYWPKEKRGKRRKKERKMRKREKKEKEEKERGSYTYLYQLPLFEVNRLARYQGMKKLVK